MTDRQVTDGIALASDMVCSMQVHKMVDGKFRLMKLSDFNTMFGGKFETDMLNDEFDSIIFLPVKNHRCCYVEVKKEDTSTVYFASAGEGSNMLDTKLKKVEGKDFRDLNHAIMDDTYELNKTTFRDSICESIKKEYIVYHDEMPEIKPSSNAEMKVCISNMGSFDAAAKYRGQKTCVLDFASATSVGGNPWAASAQEEFLCRTSTLYPCLKEKEKEFHQKHRNDGSFNFWGNDDLIYIPEVKVYKNSDMIPKILPEEKQFNVDIIVSAAPRLYDAGSVDKNEYIKIMTSRIRRILDVAEKEKVEVLIPGAFGCGAFANPPEIVAEIFNSLIRNYSFKTVDFAIIDRHGSSNYRIFNEIIKQ